MSASTTPSATSHRPGRPSSPQARRRGACRAPRGARRLGTISARRRTSASNGTDECEASWSGGDTSAALSSDETFCILDHGCEHLVRRLKPNTRDVDALEELLKTVGFDANKREWLNLLESPAIFATGVFTARGRLIGIATASKYEDVGTSRNATTTDASRNGFGTSETETFERNASQPRAHHPFGWCGNVVVDADYRGRGVAGALLRAALEDIGTNATAWLDASDMGKPLYEKAGFVARSRIVTWRRPAVPGEAPEANRSGLDSRIGFEAAARTDAAVFGADRTGLLKIWYETEPPSVCSFDGEVGYAFAHRRGDVLYLGPWGLVEGIDPAGEAAARFVDAALRRAIRGAASEERVSALAAYVPEPLDEERTEPSVSGTRASFPAGAAMALALERFGFERVSTAERMARFPNPERGGDVPRIEPGRPERALAVASLDLG